MWVGMEVPSDLVGVVFEQYGDAGARTEHRHKIMTEVKDNWTQWLASKQLLGRRMILSSIGSILIGLAAAAVLLAIAGLHPALRENTLMILFVAISLACVPLGAFVLIAGVIIKERAVIPSDIFETSSQPSPIIVPHHPGNGRKITGGTTGSEVLWLVAGSMLLLTTLIASSRAHGRLSTVVDLICSVLLFMCLSILWTILTDKQYHTRFTIDGLDNTISFTNLFTRKVREYRFRELDGFAYVQYIIKRRYDSQAYNVLFLVKRGVRVEKMTYPSDEVRDSLSVLDQLKFTDTRPVGIPFHRV